MKNLIKTFLSGLFLLSFYSASAVAEDVNVAFFLEWATPNQIAKVDKTYDDALGETVNWTNFATGVEMTEAMLSGDIDISYSQGMTPFVNAVNAKAPIKMVAIAVEYGAADDCIVADSSGISKSNADELEGQKVAVPVNTMADFGFRMTMKALGVDVDQISVVDMEPADGATALVDGNVVMACMFGQNSIDTAATAGKPMLSVAEKKAAGITSFDIISVTDKFLAENPEMVRTFVEVTHAANDSDWESKIGIIAKDAGMTAVKTKKQMSGFAFPTVAQQKEKYFSEGGLAVSMLEFMGAMFATAENPALDDYSQTINSSFLD